jgi:hypothetical protein
MRMMAESLLRRPLSGHYSNSLDWRPRHRESVRVDRRRFLQNLAATAAAVNTLPAVAETAQRQPAATPTPASPPAPALAPAQPAATTATSARKRPPRGRRTGPVDVEGHTLVCEFTQDGAGWKVYEDLRVREGDITFVASTGVSRVMPKSAEASFADAGPEHLGLSMDDVGLAGADLLAEKLLAGGDDPDPVQVRAAAPPQGSAPQGPGRGKWTTFVGTKEAHDVTQVYPAGSTRTWMPLQQFEELQPPPTPPGPPPAASQTPPQAQAQTQAATEKRYEGLIGGWMPAPRTIIDLPGGAYIEHIVFGDVAPAPDPFIIQTWHRSVKVERGAITKTVFGHTYPAFPPARQAPAADRFYRALLAFADYWDAQLADLAPAALPDRAWIDLTAHGFAKELMIRPGGLSAKYGAVDRDYFGAEYDGFQDIFTSALYTNLEWGRFDTARAFLDDYFTRYVEPNGMINMRGPETGQFGLTLSLLARYYRYTRDRALMVKHRAKFEATAKVLTDLHDISLALPPGDPKHGLIQGWSESDACLHPRPEVWWQPYYANSAFAARGLKDLAAVWSEIGLEVEAAKAPASGRGRVGAGASATGFGALAKDWRARAERLQATLVASMRAHSRQDLKPPYMPPMPGVTLPFREAMAVERPSPQQWPHRLYAELLQPDVLPADLATQTIDTLRQYGGTTLGVVANVGPARAGSRAILGFISYGYAQMLLRLDRIEEYLLFLYSHRYHAHTRGSWTAGEVSGIKGGTALFCIPAQQTIPLLVRWMLVLEDSDEDRIYFGKALPRTWVASGQAVRIAQAPTRWGRVDFELIATPAVATAPGAGAGASAASASTVTARVTLAKPGSPKEIQVKLRAPKDAPVRSVTVNGRPATLAGPHGDTVIVQTGREQRFEIIGRQA